MGYRVIEKLSDAINLEKVKQHCYVAGIDEDVLIRTYIDAACERFTKATGVVINPSIIELTLDSFDEIVRIFQTPVISLTSVKYYDESGVDTDFDINKVFVGKNTRPALLKLKPGESWPQTDGRPGGIRINYTAGHESGMDRMIEWAILSAVAHMYEHREEVAEARYYIVPTSTQMVINMYEYKEVL